MDDKVTQYMIDNLQAEIERLRAALKSMRFYDIGVEGMKIIDQALNEQLRNAAAIEGP